MERWPTGVFRLSALLAAGLLVLAAGILGAASVPARASIASAGSGPAAVRLSPADDTDYLPLVLRAFRQPTPSATPTASARPTTTSTPTSTMTPTATPAPKGIYGRMTCRGDPAPDVSLELRFYDGSAWAAIAIATTDAGGRYVFAGVPSLASGQAYYVLYGPNEVNPAYLFDWGGGLITAYVDGGSVPGGDFDLANVDLIGPGYGSVLPLPVTFTWRRRDIVGDTYGWVLFDPANSDWWSTGDLGDVGSYTVAQLPEGVEYEKEHGWYILVYDGATSYGSSFRYAAITLLPQGGAARAVAPGQGRWDARRVRETLIERSLQHGDRPAAFDR